MARDGMLTRREVIKGAAISASAFGILTSDASRAEARAAGRFRGMNVVLFVTDQERKTQHFPPGWEQRNQPGLMRLKRHGVSFENAITNACMCSPARSTWMTGFFPAQHGVKYTLEEDMPADVYPQVELSPSFKTLGTVMAAAGYEVVYKGKWHCSKPPGPEAAPTDLDPFGFTRWNPPDAGSNQAIEQAGGGRVNNDGRYLYDDGDWQAGREGVLPYLRRAARRDRPFFLVVSLVNPHDVLFYPNTYRSAGYDDSWLVGGIHAPRTVDEDLSTKPAAQRQFLALSQGLGPLRTPAMRRNYLNFYGNLIRLADHHLVAVLDTLEETGLLEDTLVIRTADHGEMGLAHGGQRQKNFNAYEETLRVPLIYSNPRLYPGEFRSRALVSHVDFLPTLAGMFDVPGSARDDWQGVDYSRIVANPAARPVQDYVTFTFDDFQAGQPQGPYVGQPPLPRVPTRIASIREARYKLAEYSDEAGAVPSQWEMYDLAADPLEARNLAYRLDRQPAEVRRQFERLRAKLRRVRSTRLRPR